MHGLGQIGPCQRAGGLARYTSHMMIASFLLRRRRVLVLCAASLLMHYLAITWVEAHVSAPAVQAPPAAPTILASLHMAPAAMAASAAQPAAPAPLAAPKVRHKEAPHPLPPKPVREEVTEPVAAPAPAIGNGAAMPAPAESAALPAASDPVDPASATQPPEEPAASAPPAPALRVNLPPSATLALDVLRIDPDGAVWHGVAAMVWVNQGKSYTMTVEAGISVIVTRLNLLVMHSEGVLDENGIGPVTVTEKRRNRAMTATHFNRAEGTITYSASERSDRLAVGSQDKATLPMQLAAIMRADPAQLGAGLEVMVGEDKEANLFQFVLVGEEDIDSKLGKLHTWHISRPPRLGVYSSRLDVWLAPEQNWFPVQIRNSEANGAVTTQTVSKIDTP